MTGPVLRLYIAGNSAASRRAESNFLRLQQVMDLEPSQVQVIDVLSKPQLAEEAGILATPTLSYERWERARRVVGDLTDIDRVLEFLGINPKEKFKGKIL